MRSSSSSARDQRGGERTAAAIEVGALRLRRAGRRAPAGPRAAHSADRAVLPDDRSRTDGVAVMEQDDRTPRTRWRPRRRRACHRRRRAPNHGFAPGRGRPRARRGRTRRPRPRGDREARRIRRRASSGERSSTITRSGSMPAVASSLSCSISATPRPRPTPWYASDDGTKRSLTTHAPAASAGRTTSATCSARSAAMSSASATGSTGVGVVEQERAQPRTERGGAGLERRDDVEARARAGAPRAGRPACSCRSRHRLRAPRSAPVVAPLPPAHAHPLPHVACAASTPSLLGRVIDARRRAPSDEPRTRREA